MSSYKRVYRVNGACKNKIPTTEKITALPSEALISLKIADLGGKDA
jgi:hypothetical protein